MAKQGPLSGRQVANKYRLGELLGSGGMGAVYKAQDIRLNRPVAVKVMSPAGRVSAADLQHFTQLFQAEALRLASLNHPGHPSIPDIYDYFEEAANWFLVMKFIEGETLQDYLQRRGGRLSIDDVLKIGLQLADVLHYLHLRRPPMIFRDLKPANIMIAPDGRISLIEFGIARLFTPGKSQDTFVFLSPGYAAPEQHGTAQTTVRSDIYSLGATLYHLLSGTHPATNPFLFTTLSIQQPAQLASLIAQMVALDPANRPTTMAEVKDALQRMIDGTALFRPSMILPHDPLNGPSFAVNPTLAIALTQQAANVAPEPTQEVLFRLQTANGTSPMQPQEEYEKALEAYEQELAQDPTSYSALCGKGQTLYHLKRYGAALLAYEQATKLDPAQAEGYYGKSFVFRHFKQDREAFNAYLQAFSRDSRSPLALYQEGVAYLQDHKYEKALAAFEQVLQRNPWDTQAYIGKGTALYALVTLEKAIREVIWAQEKERMSISSTQTLIECDEAVRRDPTNAHAHAQKGLALYQFACYEEALVVFEEAHRLASQSYGGYWLEKGYTLLRLKRHKEAWELFKGHLFSGYYLEHLAVLGDEDYMARFARQYEEALIAYEQAIHLDPTNVYAYLGKSNTLYEIGRVAEAEAIQMQASRFEKQARHLEEQARRLEPIVYRERFKHKYRRRRLDLLDREVNSKDEVRQVETYLEFPEEEKWSSGNWYSNVESYSGVKSLTAYRLRLRFCLREHVDLTWNRQAAQLDPQSTLAHTCTGFALYKLAHYPEALAAYEQALRLDPNNVMALIGQGLVFHESGQYQEALSAYEQALRLVHDDAALCTNKGSVLCHLAHYPEALAAYEKAIQLDAQNAPAWIGKGLVLNQTGRPSQEVFAAYERAFHALPDLANAQKTPYDFEKALAVFQQSAESKGYFYITRDYLVPAQLIYPCGGNGFYHRGEYSSAIALYEQAASINAEAVPLFIDKLIACQQKIFDRDRHTEIFGHREEYVAVPSDFRLAIAKGYLSAAERFYQRSRHQAVVAACEIASALQPRDTKVLLYKGVALRHLARYDAALAIYNQVIRLDPNLAMAYHNKGNLLLENLHWYGEAVKAYDRALSLRSPLSVIGKEKALNKQRVYQDILNAEEHLIRFEPRNANAYVGKGYAFFQLSQYQEALGAFQQAINLDPENVLAHRGKADALTHLERNTEAQQAYQLALQCGYNEYVMTEE